MSYEYDFFRVTSEVQSPDDLNEENMEPIGSLADVQSALTALFPKARLSEEGGWLDPDTPMGDVLFSEDESVMKTFSISRIDLEEVKSVCRALGVVAFDGQEMLLIRP